MTVKYDPAKVANYLKALINDQFCEDGFKWFEDVGEMPNIFDIMEAIKILAGAEPKSLEVTMEEGGDAK